MMRYMTALPLLLLTATLACQAPSDAPVAEVSEAALPEGEAFGAALLSTLTVTEDGALTFRDEARARQLLGKDFTEAAREMELLNQAIDAGQVPPFRDDAALLDYQLVLQADELSSDHAYASTRCRGSCLGGTCCVSGWWIFCWGYGTC